VLPRDLPAGRRRLPLCGPCRLLPGPGSPGARPHRRPGAASADRGFGSPVDLKERSGHTGQVLEGFHQSVRGWFAAKYGTPTEPQSLGWPHIQRGEDTLIAAPTGSGKTLAAFLACLDAMIREGDALRDETQILYVSP